MHIKELHCIMPMDNIPSVMKNGILSYERAAKLRPKSVAMQAIQDRRDKIRVPDGLRLHQYANLYFDARNPMMYKRKEEAHLLCVLRLSRDVLESEGVVLTDMNASSQYVRFLSPKQIGMIKFDKVFAEDWRHPGNPAAYHRHKAMKCAEVLVPHVVPVRFIQGAYVVNTQAKNRLSEAGFTLDIRIRRPLFFS